MYCNNNNNNDTYITVNSFNPVGFTEVILEACLLRNVTLRGFKKYGILIFEQEVGLILLRPLFCNSYNTQYKNYLHYSFFFKAIFSRTYKIHQTFAEKKIISNTRARTRRAFASQDQGNDHMFVRNCPC